MCTEESPVQVPREWEKALDAIGDWICLVDLDGRIQRSNRAGEELLGVTTSEMNASALWYGPSAWIWRNSCTLLSRTSSPIWSKTSIGVTQCRPPSYRAYMRICFISRGEAPNRPS